MKQLNTKSATLAAAAFALALSGTAAVTVNGVAHAAKDVPCYGVNTCKGTSDCKTATTSCKGHNNCKGQGFVLMSKSQCKAVGGKTSK